MSEPERLPKGWATSTVGDLASISTGKLDVNAGAIDGKYPFFTCGQEVHRINEYAFDGDAILLAGNGNFNVKWYSGKFNAYQRTYVIQPRQPIGVRFFYYHMQERLAQITQGNRGSTIRFIRLGDVRDCVTRIPPLREQRRIVEKIEELFSDLDAGVAALERARANLKRYRSSVLKAAVEGNLTAEWRAKHTKVEAASKLLERILKERRRKWEADQLAKFAAAGKQPPKDWQTKYVEPTPPDRTTTPNIPEGWIWTCIGQCFEVCVGATPSRKAANYWNGTIPWVSSGEVQFCRIHDTREHITDEGFANSSTRLNPRGSVLLGMIGEGKTRGQVAILDIDACNNQNCAAIWVSQTPIDPMFVYCWLWSRYETTRRQSSGNNQPALNKTRVERISMPLPPLVEQFQIVTEAAEKLSQIEAADVAIDHGLLRAARLRQSILKQAFEGKLVLQDASDEPATVLLEPLRNGRLPAETNNGKERARRRAIKRH